MSEIKRWLTMSFLLTFGLPGLLCAQEKSGTADGKNETPEQTSRTDSPSRKRPAYRGLSASQILVQRFDRQAPQLGDLLPDAAGLDSDGNEFKLRGLKGHYTVLTFGCLT
jgi:hypothetical protein